MSEELIEKIDKQSEYTNKIGDYSTVGDSPGWMLEERFTVRPEISPANWVFKVIVVPSIKN